MSEEEKKLVEEVFNNAIDCLSDEDKKLPQVRPQLHVSVFYGFLFLFINFSTPPHCLA